MKLKFKRQQFQQDAVNAVVECFAGQPNEASSFVLDKGTKPDEEQLALAWAEQDYASDVGFKNKEIKLVDSEILANVRKVQQRNGLKVSDALDGRYNLTVEMETGTGKTYVYIKTMFELNKRYGWSKFIVVVPSIAIREGVYKSFQMTEEHFMQEYGKKVRCFIYNSKQLHNIDSFAGDAGINVMIINSQAFAARGKDARRIYMELDEFQSRMPIEVIARTNPIVIIDEPQSVEGTKTKEGLKEFRPLFSLRYSATHRPGQEYNKVYRLDALDAYNQKLVKKISVKGITVKGTTGTDGYLYLEGIEISAKQAPVARIEYEEKNKSGLKRVIRKLSVNDDLYQLSGNLEQYQGYRISEINGYKNTVHFTNGLVLSAGELRGDVTEQNYRRIQIRETILSHLEKERELFFRGIKVLSLFFIDEVAKYRQYDKDGNASNGEYAALFEEEYVQAIDHYLTVFADDPYVKYLREISARDTHKGYFSIDKKQRFVDPKTSAREKESDDVDAYDLIMRDKEVLLSFTEPTRFIFSHSALREGWDNPNVFQICTLKHSESTIKKRQEVGRGLRLCVDQQGNRMDASVPGIDVHDINILTVVASESYESFAKELQKEIAETLADRPKQADITFFLNKVIQNERGESLVIGEQLAKKLYKTFAKQDYIDDNDQLTAAYFDALSSGSLAIPEEFAGFDGALVQLVSTIYAPTKTPMPDNALKNNIKTHQPNQNFYREEFQQLWQQINRKTAYTVQFATDELVQKCIAALDERLTVPDVQYVITSGVLEELVSRERLQQGDAFQAETSSTKTLKTIAAAKIRYDLVGKLMEETRLTRKTIAGIMKGIKPQTFALFRKNPEEFILRAGRLINEQKAATVIQCISYNVIDGAFDTNIFTLNSSKAVLGQNAHPMKKHIFDYLVTDSKVEQTFAGQLDISEEVCVFAKLPRGFYIPTPVGNYNPDWAIVFNDVDVKYVYFIAETKGNLESLELREIEKAKIHCARQHFAKISSARLKYDVVNSFERLLEIVRGSCSA